MTSYAALPDRPRLVGRPVIVWRSHRHLQVGLDDDALVFESVPPGMAMVLNRMDGHHTVSQLSRHLDEPWLAWLLTALAEHGRIADGPVPARAPAVRVIGMGSLGGAVAHGLLALGQPVRLHDPTASSARRVREVVNALAAGHPLPLRPMAEPDIDPSAPVALTVLAVDTIEPDRLLTDRLTASGIPYLVVRLQPGRAVVGPLVIPGVTACVRCTDLVQAASDDAWPVIACALAQSPAPASPTLSAWAAALAVAHTSTFLRGGDPESMRGTIEIGDDGVTRFRSWSRIPSCHCERHARSTAPARMVA
jgi:hypothetical protein